jgi:hypothetical protein
MVMDVIRINQGHVSQYRIIDDELNADANKLFYLLKDFDELLLDDCTNHSKLSVIARVFTIKSDYGLSEVGYDMSEKHFT